MALEAFDKLDEGALGYATTGLLGCISGYISRKMC